MTSGTITVTTRDQIAEVLLNRPEKRNAMTYAMWVELADACTAATSDPDVRVVVLRGAGGNFCAGADIGDLGVVRPPDAPSFHDVNTAAETALATMPRPTVAAIEGDCIGGGCALAIDCDFRLAAPSARFGITPAKLGIVYPAASLERAAAVLGFSATKRLMMTGELIDAPTALGLGLIDRICDDLDAEVAALAGELAERSLLTQVATKEMAAAIVRHGHVPEPLVQRWSAIQAASADGAEGRAAFTERRRPAFTWKP